MGGQGAASILSRAALLALILGAGLIGSGGDDGSSGNSVNSKPSNRVLASWLVDERVASVDVAAAWWTSATARPGRVAVVGLPAGRELQSRQVLVRSGRELVEAAASAIICAEPFTIWTTERGCEWALAVVECESGFNPNADTNPPFVGWWQVLNGPYDPYLNTVEAHIQYWEWQGPNAWREVSPWPRCPRGAPGLPVVGGKKRP